jgi:hypothetical protein
LVHEHLYKYKCNTLFSPIINVQLVVSFFFVLSTMIPNMIIIAPITTIIKPLFVHFELLYMDEEEGPIIELLCNTKIIPDKIIIIPIIIKYLPYFLKVNAFT